MQGLLDHLRSIEAGYDTNERLLKRFEAAPANDKEPTQSTDIYTLLRKEKGSLSKPKRRQQKKSPALPVETLTNRRERLHTLMSYELNRRANISLVPIARGDPSPPKPVLNKRLQQALSTEHDLEAQELRAAERSVEVALHDAEVLLPLSFLMERNLAALCQSKAGAIIQAAFRTFLLHFFDDAWHHWLSYMHESRARERDAAAQLLGRVYRGHRARTACIHLRASIAALEATKALVLAQRIQRRHASAVVLQMAFRTSRRQKREAATVAQTAAAHVIQRLMLFHKSRTLRFAAMLADAKRHQSATSIQRVLRGRRGRRRAARIALDKKRLVIFRKLCDPALAVANRFESQGAAFRIQRCARAWLRRCAGRRFRTQIRRDAAEARLAQAIAGYVVRRQYRRHKAALAASLPTRRQAARLIQKVLQRWIGQRKWQLSRIVRRKEDRLRRAAALAQRRGQPLAKVSRGLKRAKEQAAQTLSSLFSTTAIAARAADSKLTAAVVIQRGWRCARLRYRKYLRDLYARIEYISLRKSALFGYATKIQRLWRGRRARKQVKYLWLDKVTRNAVAKWRARRLRRRHNAASRIQHKFRSMRGRRMAKVALAKMVHARASAIVLQRLCRPWLARQRVHRQRDIIRRRHETLLFCTASLRRCRQAAMDYLVFKSIEGSIGDVLTYPPWVATGTFYAHDISFPLFQLLFLDYSGLKREHLATMPLKELTALRLDRSKFLKVFRDAFPNSTRHVDMASDADHVLGKLKEHPNQSRVSLTYSAFATALQAMSPLQIKPKKTDIPPDTRFLLLVWKQICTGKWATKLKAPEHLEQYANQWLGHAARRIQRLVRRRRDRDRGNALLHIKRLEYQQSILTEAAAMIQRAWRTRTARCYLRALLRSVFRKYIDAATGMPYWTNPRTGYSTWKKPAILGKGDVDHDVIPMADADTEFALRCTNCNINPIAEHCFHCEDMYCKSCFASLHGKGKMTSHIHFPIDGCSLCQYQVGTRRCTECAVPYCDNCIRYVHQRGNLAFHTFTPLVTMCNQCEGARASRDQCVTHNVQLCRVCAHAHPPEACRLEAMPFMSFSLDAALNRVHSERKAKLEAEQKRMQDERDLEARRLASAIRIQRNWRRKEAHQKGFALVLALAKAKQAEWAKLQRDRKKERTVQYALKDVFGKAEFLETDTAAIRVLRRLNVFTRHKARAGSITARVRRLQVPLDEYVFQGVLLPGHASIAKGSKMLETSEDIRGWVVNGQALRIQDRVYYIHATEALMDATVALHEPFDQESVTKSPYYAVEFSTTFPTNLKGFAAKRLLPAGLHAAVPELRVVHASASCHTLPAGLSPVLVATIGAKVQALANRVDEDSVIGKSLTKMAKSVQAAAIKKKVAMEERLEKEADQRTEDRRNERRRSVLSDSRRRSSTAAPDATAIETTNQEAVDEVTPLMEYSAVAPQAESATYGTGSGDGVSYYGDAAYYQQALDYQYTTAYQLTMLPDSYAAYSYDTAASGYDYTQPSQDYSPEYYNYTQAQYEYTTEFPGASTADQAEGNTEGVHYEPVPTVDSYDAGYAATGDSTQGYTYEQPGYEEAAPSAYEYGDAPAYVGSAVYDVGESSAYLSSSVEQPTYEERAYDPNVHAHQAYGASEYALESYAQYDASTVSSQAYDTSANAQWTYDANGTPWAYDSSSNAQEAYDASSYYAQGAYDASTNDPATYELSAYEHQAYNEQAAHEAGAYDYDAIGHTDNSTSYGYDAGTYGQDSGMWPADTGASSEPWQEIYDPSSGQMYYYNAVTGESVWK
ncbi:hypothetical protein ACHHYP_08977 [Achlya hypogyna]|uniref:Probable pectate lyase F n=1 Tax=Achlya hypogyna TaxID=1202772 RepID=A0A1V9ZJI0_ACHHY|nr:hypothetical protein ACHHYP_08977 [Achlya hypogyna]